MNPSACAVALILYLLAGPTLSLAQPTENRTGKSAAFHSIRKSIKDGQRGVAEKLLDFHLSQNPKQIELWQLRRALANSWARSGDREKADAQLQKMIQFIYSDPTSARPLILQLPQLLGNLADVQNGVEPESSQWLNPAIALFTTSIGEIKDNYRHSIGLTNLINQKIRIALQKKRDAEALQLYTQELRRLRRRTSQHAENVNEWFQLTRNLTKGIDTFQSIFADQADAWRVEKTNVLNFAFQNFKGSSVLMTEYFVERMESTIEYETIVPSLANQRYDQAIDDIRGLIKKNRAIQRVLLPVQIKLEKQRQRFLRSQAKTRLIGQQAPSLGPVRWLRGKFDLAQGQIQLRNRPAVICFVAEPRQLNAMDLNAMATVAEDRNSAADWVVLLPELGKSFKWLKSFKRVSTTTAQQKSAYEQQLLTAVIDRQSLSVGLLDDPATVADQWGINQLPAMVVLAADSTVLAIMSGDELSGGEIPDQVINVLASE